LSLKVLYIFSIVAQHISILDTSKKEKGTQYFL